MCNSLLCSRRMQCLRWVAKAEPIQSFAKFPDNDCQNFIQATEQEIKAYCERKGIEYGRISKSSRTLSE